MKKRVLLMLTAFLLLLSACTGGTPASSDAPPGNSSAAASGSPSGDAPAADGGAASGGITISAPGVMPITEETITFSALCLAPVNDAYTTDMEDNWVTQWYEELTNVHIEWEMSIGDADSNAQKLQLKIVSGDYPDLFLKTGIDRNLLYECGQDGILIPLNDLIDTHSVELKKIFETTPRERDLVTTPDGNIYGLGYITAYYHGTAPNKIWVYQPWMDQLGIETPQTTEEYYDMLMRFKNEDPNGNGQADEVPLLNINHPALLSPFLSTSTIQT